MSGSPLKADIRAGSQHVRYGSFSTDCPLEADIRFAGIHEYTP